MAQLSQVIADIQREAAAIPTGELGKHVQASLELLTEYIDVLNGIGPAPGPVDMSSAANDVLYAALFTALYVQELATRPARRFARVRLSIN
jgi:hypothetical protein